MKNALKFLGLIALVAVIGFSFVACGEGPQGEQGETGQQGEKGEKGDPGTPGTGAGMLPYIPAESGLLSTTWIEDDDPNPYTLTFSGDGYTVTRTVGSSSGTDFQVINYGKRPDGSLFVTAVSFNTIYYFTISGNTLTWNSVTYTKQ
jgi:hypothetical protein